MKFIVDMNLSHRWVNTLKSAGIEAVHWSSLGLGPNDTPDIEIMNAARAGGYTVLTNDLDFGGILAVTNWGKPSVVQFGVRIFSRIRSKNLSSRLCNRCRVIWTTAHS